MPINTAVVPTLPVDARPDTVNTCSVETETEPTEVVETNPDTGMFTSPVTVTLPTPEDAETPETTTGRAEPQAPSPQLPRLQPVI